MMEVDLDKLTTAAATVVVKELISGGMSAGKSVWGWIKGKASDSEESEIAKIEANPEKPSAPDKLKALLKDLLHEQPEMQEELARLIEEKGGPSVQQFSNVTGDGNIVGQIAGSGNSFKVIK